MRFAAFLFVLTFFVARVEAQTPAERYRSAEKIWLSHRPDGMTWDDGSLQASAAINAMWTAGIDEANAYLVSHPSASPKQVESDLKLLDPETDPKFGPPLDATVLRLQRGLFAVSLTNFTASIVFVLKPNVQNGKVWRIDQSASQLNDPKGLLQAWRSDHANDGCRDTEPKNTYGTCGPVRGSVGMLPPEASGAPRFYVDADYSKDAGALILKQTSIWRWSDGKAQLLWIDDYSFSLDVDDGVHYRNGELQIIEKRFPRTFTSCNSCFEPTTLRRIRIAPDSIKDLGETSRAPQLDLIDEFFWRIAHKMPTESVATAHVASALRGAVLQAIATPENEGPDSAYVGMLEEWSVTRYGSRFDVCFIAGELGRIDFMIEKSPGDSTKSSRLDSPVAIQVNVPRREYTPQELRRSD